MVKKTSTRKRPVGLKEIAEELNVSISLVSKVLSGRLGTSGANEETARAIHAKARELNFYRNPLAEALRGGRQNVYAVFIHRHGVAGSAIIDKMIAGIAEEAATQRQRLLIHYYESAEDFRALSPLVHNRSVDGMIVAGLPHGELADDLREIHDRGLPIVTVHDSQIDSEFANVGVDQSAVTDLATTHLIDQGCRSIAHFRVVDAVSKLPTRRFEGYQRALTRHRLKVNSELVVKVPDFSHESGLLAVRQLVDAGVEFDGIVGQSDVHAVAALNYLVRNGRAVPQKIKLIGVDDAPFCQYAIIPLSSVSQQFHERGRLAVQLLAKIIAEEPVESLQLQPTIVVRESSSLAESK